MHDASFPRDANLTTVTAK